MLLPTVVLFGLAFQLLQTDIPFYVHAVVGKHSWLGATLLLVVAIAAAVVCVPLFARLGRRTSKRHAYRLSMLAAAVTFPLLGVAGLLPGIPATAQLLVVAALVGAPIGAHFLFPVPLTADVIDDDSATTHAAPRGDLPRRLQLRAASCPRGSRLCSWCCCDCSATRGATRSASGSWDRSPA